MIARAGLRTEGRQFVRLVRASYRRFLDAVFGSRDMDAEQVALWAVVLMATPTLYAAFIWTSRYLWLRKISIERLHQAVLADRFFFVLWPMAMALFVAALLWDALLPDRTDQQILGVLPVRSRTVAAARLAAAFVTGLVVVAGVTVPAAVLYAAAGAVDPSVGGVVGIAFGQSLAGMAAGLFALAVALTVRGALAAVFGVAGSARAAVLIQFAAVALIVEAFLFLPGMLPPMVRAVIAGQVEGVATLPVTFMGLYALFAGPHAEKLTGGAPAAGVWVVAAVAASGLACLAPAAWNARRAIEARQSSGRASLALAPFLALARLLTRRDARARFLFVVRTLLRSRRHVLTVASYAGFGVAIAATRLVSASLRGRPIPLEVPSTALVAIPMVLTYFLVLGVRVAFAIPSDPAAAWVFRIAGPATVLDARPATRLALWAIAVLPVTLLAVVSAAWLWSIPEAVAVGVMHAASGVMLCEVVMRGVDGMPFARPRHVSATSLKVGIPVVAFGAIVYAVELSSLQRWTLDSPQAVAAYAGGMAALAVGAAWLGRRRVAAMPVAFDAPTDGLTALDLRSMLH